jgi:hypothetical protein
MRLLALFVSCWTVIAGFYNETDGVPLSEGEGGSQLYFGVLKLADVDYKHLPADCDQPLAHACTDEANGNYSASFAAHESRLQRCGWHGFVRKRVLGPGDVAPVFAMTSPCGMEFAGKTPRRLTALHHVARDCIILRKLEHHLTTPECNHCFPQYYYLSNVTGVCYAELLHAMPVETFFRQLNASQPELLLPAAKMALHQGMNSLRILQSEGIRHQDLTFRNTMIRIERHDPAHPFRVVIYDFGGSYSPELGQVTAALHGGLGNHGYSDTYAWACAFYKYFYGKRFCTDRSGYDPATTTGTLQGALIDIMKRHPHDHSVDFTGLQAHIDKVTGF